MNADQAKKLREPFPADTIGKLPKPTKKDNPKGKCQECGGWHGLPAVHLDYVGHAAVTDRLLSVDPAYTWEFLAANADGSPVVYTSGLSDHAASLGLWIRLCVAGVWTPGFGEGKNFKEAISDAIRNAAMRRGVALDLWSKEDLHASDSSAGEPSGAAVPQTAPAQQRKPDESQSRAGQAPAPAAAASPAVSSPPESREAALRAGDAASRYPIPDEVQSELATKSAAPRLVPDDNGDPAQVRVHFGKNAGKTLGELSAQQLRWYAVKWEPGDRADDRRLRAAAMLLMDRTAA